MAFWSRKSDESSPNSEAETANHAATVEIVNNAKENTAKSAKEANETIERINKLLVENGITLKIIIAAGGKNRGH